MLHSFDHHWLCDVCLQIIVEYRTNVLDLVNTLTNLRPLYVQNQDNKWINDRTLPLIDDELAEWLRSHLPCTIVRDTYFVKYIRLWIR